MIQHFCQWILNLLNTNGRWRYVSSDLCWKFWFIIRLHSWHYNILIGKLSWFQKRKWWKKENRDSTQRKIYNLSGLARRYNCRCPHSTLPLLYESPWSAIRRSHIILPLLFGRVFPSYTKRTGTKGYSRQSALETAKSWANQTNSNAKSQMVPLQTDNTKFARADPWGRADSPLGRTKQIWWVSIWLSSSRT